MRRSNSLISVLVAVYNIKEYVEDCIKSICDQSYTELEIIIIDDGSTDGSERVCDRLAETDDRIAVYHKSNGGLVSARKYAMERAHGEYLLTVDGDDCIKPDMIEHMYMRIKETDADVVQCGYGSNLLTEYVYPDFTIKVSDDSRTDIVKKWLMQEPIFDSQVVTKLCKRDFLRDTYASVPDECSYSEDWIWFVECVKKASIISSLSEVFYEYTIREGSLSHQTEYGISYLIDNDRMMNLLYCRIKEYFPALDDESLKRWYLKRRTDTLRTVCKKEYNTEIYRYSGDLVSCLNGKRVAIYGAGVMGGALIEELPKYEDISVVAWFDREAGSKQSNYRSVLFPEKIRAIDFDKLVIAIADENRAYKTALEISEEYDIPMEKIIWKYSRKMTLF